MKRQKSAEPAVRSSISDKFNAGTYSTIDEIAADIGTAVGGALSELETQGDKKSAAKLHEFKSKALHLFHAEKSYPYAKPEGSDEQAAAFGKGSTVLSLVGFAPQERRLFSSLPADHAVDLSAVALPPGISIARVNSSDNQERTMTLGELFGPQRALPPLHPPKQPKSQAKGNTLDFYRPEMSDKSKYRANSYFNTKLAAGYYLDYSNATPSSETVPKQRERAESLAGKKPSMSELELSEVESLFRGAFSAFAPCRDDSAAVVPTNVASRMWWQRSGQPNFERMIEVEYYDDNENGNARDPTEPGQVDEAAIQDAIDNWDTNAVDPSLEDAMGSRKEEDRDADDILEEVSDMIETLASYQRIRNLTLPNSQNRQSSDPVKADMLSTAGPQPSEEEQATYEMLKAQLSLIIKTLPPYAVAKLNGDQLDELLISTKLQVQTDDYRGVMEEDDAGVQARMRAQQQQQQQQPQPQPQPQQHHQQQQYHQQPQHHAAQAYARQQRTPSMSGQFPTQYQANAQYGTPGRTPSQQQYYRPGSAQNYQQPHAAPSPQQPRPPQPNQYTRQNGFNNQYATQLAKAQTPYGHQNMPQHANQQRPPFNQMPQQQTPQQGTPNARYQFQPGYQGTPTPANYGGYANGAPMPPQRNMSPQQQHIPQRQMYSQSPNMPQNQQFAPPTQQGPPPAQVNRYASGNQAGYSQSPGLTGYHTVISEAQQQRILDQAKARVAAQGGGTPSYNSTGLAQARAALANQPTPHTPGMNGSPAPPSKVTPVPVPAVPGGQQGQQPQQEQQQQQQ